MTPSGGPADPAARQQWRAARREAARAHHPDLGGDADSLTAALRRVDEQFGVARRAGGDRPTVVVRRTARGAPGRVVRGPRRVLRLGLRRVRSALPRGWPGSRRYLDL